jgi:hypothetical protein
MQKIVSLVTVLWQLKLSILQEIFIRRAIITGVKLITNNYEHDTLNLRRLTINSFHILQLLTALL